MEKSTPRDADLWQELGDRALVDALREGQPEAVDEFIRRFEPLVTRRARWFRVPAAERSHWVGELLYDVAMTLTRGRGSAPQHLGAYITSACRHRIAAQRANDAAYRNHISEAVDDGDADAPAVREPVVTSVYSAGSLAAARGPDWERPSLSPVLERLASFFNEKIRADDWRLLDWLGSQISYTTIAQWLGITRPAAVSRIQRLRARLIDAALRYASTVDVADRAALIKYLRRTGAVAEERLIALEKKEDSP